MTTSISRPRSSAWSTSTTFKGRTSLLVINKLKNHRVRRTSSILWVFNLSLDITSGSCSTSRTTSYSTTARTTATTSSSIAISSSNVQTTGSTSCSTSTSRPPSNTQAVPIPHAPQAVHSLAGRHYNQPRGPPPRPQATNIIDLPQPAEPLIMLGPDLVGISVDANIASTEQQLQEDLIRQTLELQAFHEDGLGQYIADNIKTITVSELHSLGKKNSYGEVDIDSLTSEERESTSSRPRGSSDLDHLRHELMTLMTYLKDLLSKIRCQGIQSTLRRPHQAEFRSNASKNITTSPTSSCSTTSCSTTSTPSHIMRHLIRVFEYSHR